MSFFYRVARAASRFVGADSMPVRLVRPLIERVLRATTGRHGLAWEINGIPCRIDPRFRAQLARNYDAHIVEFLRNRIRSGQTCLDVGANIGAWVIQFAHFVGPTGRVIAFEPNADARSVLETHIRLNHLESVVQVVPAAVGANPGEVTFFASGADGMSRIGQPNPDLKTPSISVTVPVMSLDTWCRENGVSPDWLLIDVEGFEGHALAGATELVKSRGPDLGIIVEMHPSLWAVSGTTRAEVADRIAAVRRRAVSLTGQKDPFAEYGHVSLDPI